MAETFDTVNHRGSDYIDKKYPQQRMELLPQPMIYGSFPLFLIIVMCMKFDRSGFSASYSFFDVLFFLIFSDFGFCSSLDTLVFKIVRVQGS